MRRITGAMLAVAAGLMSAGPAWAQGTYQPRVGFEIEGERYSIAPPPNYCRATGSVDAEFRRYEKDAESELLFALVPCGPGADGADYILVKHAANADGPGRVALLKQMRAEFPSFDTGQSNRSNSEMIGDSLSDLIGGKVDVAVDIRPLGVDDVCAYMGGSLKYERTGKSGVIAIAACVTAIGPRAIFLFRYLPSTDAVRVKGMVGEGRAMALSLKAE